MNATVVDVVQNAYGYKIIFGLQKPDGTPFDLTGNTAIKLNVQFANTSGTKFSSNLASAGTLDDGTVSYTVAQGEFDQAGTYLAEIELDTAAAKQIWPNITFRCYKQIPTF